MFYKSVVSPLLDRLDSEQMHHFARESLRLAEGSEVGRLAIRLTACGRERVVSEKLHTRFAGLEFENPVIVAAGWDKDARSVRGLWELGFGGIEIGSVLENPQPGNPKPRQFIIAPGVALNSLGFNSGGMERVAQNLRRYNGLSIPIGINIGKNKEVTDADAPRAYAVVAKRLYHDASYFVVNVSSPNTPGLRKLQDRGLLTEILRAVIEAVESVGERKPIFVKIAPDLTAEAVDDVISVALEHRLAGIVATNTTNNVDLKGKYGAKWRALPGGVSGDDDQYRQMATEKIRQVYRAAGRDLAIIGIGGVKDGKTALEKIFAGASAVQVMTALRGVGPRVVTNINREILDWMNREGVQSLSEVIGSDAR